ncbi:hypothetical protein [Kitasatospora sp. McL0602]|uniref:hypothetical protein n=1 Tax=Kitasatospora sp. McL0602 TaxID=3439530 RepID=UPI003F8B4043
MRRSPTLPALLLLPFAAAGCAAPAPAAQAAPPPPACRALAEAVVPQTAGTLGENDSGAYCLAVGAQLAVFLHADGPGRWAGVVSSAPAVLATASTARLTAPVGVTPGQFRAAARGTAELSSQDATGRSWRVTVVVD